MQQKIKLQYFWFPATTWPAEHIMQTQKDSTFNI